MVNWIKFYANQMFEKLVCYVLMPSTQTLGHSVMILQCFHVMPHYQGSTAFDAGMV